VPRVQVPNEKLMQTDIVNITESKYLQDRVVFEVDATNIGPEAVADLAARVQEVTHDTHVQHLYDQEFVPYAALVEVTDPLKYQVCSILDCDCIAGVRALCRPVAGAALDNDAACCVRCGGSGHWRHARGHCNFSRAVKSGCSHAGSLWTHACECLRTPATPHSVLQPSNLLHLSRGELRAGARVLPARVQLAEPHPDVRGAHVRRAHRRLLAGRVARYALALARARAAGRRPRGPRANGRRPADRRRAK
jgi:hypothetical protein